MAKTKTFSTEVREKLLLWCDRHCCLCRKQCDLFIELHHIVPKSEGGTDDDDNAIPLCFDCHGRVGHYNAEHPKGAKYRASELKRRRDQVYDEFTRHLVPALHYRIETRGDLPDVGFSIAHLGDTPPVRVGVTVEPYIDYKKCTEFGDSVYQGQDLWNLNPREGVSGHFLIPDRALETNTPIIIGVKIVIHDCLDRVHSLLPVTYVHDRNNPGWWLDPFEVITSVRRLKKHFSGG